MKVVFAFLMFSVLAFHANAQDKFLKDKAQTEQLSEKVVELFYNNNVNGGLQELAPYWPIPENERDAMAEKTIKLMNMLIDRFGKPIDTLKLRTQTIGDIAIRETYLIRNQYSAIRLIFTYYKNPNGWIVNGFKWDDSFEEEFR